MTNQELERRLTIIESSLNARVSAIERVLRNYMDLDEELRGTMLDELMRIRGADIREAVREAWNGK